MKGSADFLLRVSLVCCAAAIPIQSATLTNPYPSIAERNVFGLKPLVAAPVSENPKSPPAKILLTGIATIDGTRVLLKTPAGPGNPGEPLIVERFYMLRKGERDGDVEVVDVDMKTMSVRINNGGTSQLLTFENNGVTLSVAQAPPPPPAVLPVPYRLARR